LKEQLAFLQHLNRTLFLILRNLNGKRLPDRGPFVLPHLQGELIGLTRSFESAQKLIPQPEYPADYVLQQRFHERFGWRNLPLSDGTLVQQVPDVKFDHRPRRESIQNDRELFGKSYTVFWVSPFLLNIIVADMLDRAEELRQRESRKRHFPDSQINTRVLKTIRERHLNRLCLALNPLAEIDSQRFQEQIWETFRKELSLKSNAPREATWDQLM